MPGRNPSDPTVKKLGEDLQLQISGVKKGLKVVKQMLANMGMTARGRLDTPQAAIPHLIAQRSQGSLVYPTVKFLIPTLTEELRALYIDKAENQILSGETEAQAKARAQSAVAGTILGAGATYRISVAENNQAAGFIEAEIGPVKPKGDGTARQIQLIRIVALDDRTAFAKNPDQNPFTGDVFPFPAILVRDKYDIYDTGKMPGSDITVDADKFYFNVGPSIDTPSGPLSANIVGNTVNVETGVKGDCKTSFKVQASAVDPTRTFQQTGARKFEIRLKKFSEADSAGDDEGPITATGEVMDPSQTFIIIDKILELGERYKWKAVVATNGEDKIVVRPSQVVDFFGGGSPATAGIPEIKAFTLSVAPLDNFRVEATITIEQYANGQPLAPPPSPQLFATLLKRATIGIKKRNGNLVVEKKIPLLDEEGVFIQGASVSFTRRIHIESNRQAAEVSAELFAINHTPAVPIKRTATAAGDSDLNVKPSDPAPGLIFTAPDDDTVDGDDAFADFTVSLVPPQTFADAQIDTIGIRLRKTSGMSDDDPDDNRRKLDKFPIEPEQQGLMEAVFRIRNLKYGRRYFWVRNVAFRNGVNGARSRSLKVNVPFRAGLALQDPSGISISGTASPFKKRNADIFITLVQTTPPVFLKNIQIFQDLNDGLGFPVEPLRVINVKDNPKFQVAGGTITIKRRVEIPPGVTGIRYFLRAVAVGGLSKDSAPFTQSAAGGPEAPTDLPSVPTPADIIFNGINQDVGMGSAKVTVRIAAEWNRIKTFAQVLADSARFILTDPGDAANPSMERYPSPKATPDPTATTVDIEFPSLVAGKQYLLKRNITYRNGVPAKSQISNVAFVAGGPIGTTGSPGLPELSDLSVTLQQIMSDGNKPDSRSAEYILRFTQAKTQTGAGGTNMSVVSGQFTATVTSTSDLRVGYTVRTGLQSRTVISINSSTSITVDQAWIATTNISWTFTPPVVLIKRIKPSLVRNLQLRPRKGERILDDPFDDNQQPIIAAGAKQITRDINVPKKSNFSVTVRIISVGNNFRDVSATIPMTSPEDEGLADSGAPNATPRTTRLRWREGENGTLRVRFALTQKNPGDPIGDADNLLTHFTNKVLFKFLVFGSGAYLWNPDSRQTLFIGGGTADPLNNPAHMPFLVDIGKGTSANFNNRVPKNDAQGNQNIDTDDDVLFNDLSVRFSTLNCGLYVFNRFGDEVTGTLVATAANIDTTPRGAGAGFDVNENTF